MDRVGLIQDKMQNLLGCKWMIMWAEGDRWFLCSVLFSPKNPIFAQDSWITLQSDIKMADAKRNQICLFLGVECSAGYWVPSSAEGTEYFLFNLIISNIFFLYYILKRKKTQHDQWLKEGRASEVPGLPAIYTSFYCIKGISQCFNLSHFKMCGCQCWVLGSMQV